MTTPTLIEYGALQRAFDHLNAELFRGELPQCLITLDNNRASSVGYFQRARFSNADGEKVDCIALNPGYLGVRSLLDSLSTLAHEMVHAWQAHFGKEPKRCYHDRAFSAKCLEIGLQTSDTGRPYGKPVGERMDHYIVRGGRFHCVARDLIETENFRVEWFERLSHGDQTVTVLAPALSELPPREVLVKEVTERDLSVILGHPPKAAILVPAPHQGSPIDSAVQEADDGTEVAAGEEAPLMPPPSPSTPVMTELPSLSDKAGSLGIELASPPAVKPGSLIRKPPSNAKAKTCYECPSCDKVRVWGRGGLRLLCIDCSRELVARG